MSRSRNLRSLVLGALITFVAACSADRAVSPPVKTPPPPPPAAESAEYGVALPKYSIDTHPADMPSPGTVRHVHAGDTLQAVLDRAQAGDSVVIDVGLQFVGNFHIAPKAGASASKWLTVTAAGAPTTEGVRTTKADHLAALISPNDAAALEIDSGSAYVNLSGLEMTVTPAVTISYGLLWIDPTSQHTNTDHLYLHGSPTLPIVRAVLMNGAWDAVTDSYISDIHGNNFDSQAITSYSGPGPYKIVNNYLEAAGENIMFGGSDPTVPGQVPSDIEIRGNHFFKPLSWGSTWTVKNLFELKDAVRVLVEGNVFENCWAAGQIGNALLIQAVSQQGTAPWSTVSDVTFKYNYVTNASAGFYINAATSSQIGTLPTQHAARILIENNVFDKIGLDPVIGTGISDGNMLLLENDIHGITLDHNTFIGASHLNSALQAWNTGLGPIDSLAIRDNIIDLGDYGFVQGANSSVTPTIAGNVLFVHAGYPNGSAGGASAYPVGNAFAASADSVGFTSLLGGNYALLATSPFHGKATDGRDPGADIAGLNARLAGVR